MTNKMFGNFIKKIRIQKNISTSEIAKNLTVSEAEYIRYENGDMSIYIDDLFVIAKILDTDVNYLLNIYEKNSSFY
ncbi:MULTISPECIES: helix-turn-helix domain-containing protein [Providencia]|uniref:helix-turn-helix domain-containing protein n=1 Tax=Providencia TaxID=586 RepID=UPI0012B5E5CC|nr:MULTISPECIES: helix-turn-helix transcriptional regulator [Providencia]MTC55206.1 helix-turn-helix domain-containing protein [Providencia rustigianii]